MNTPARSGSWLPMSDLGIAKTFHEPKKSPLDLQRLMHFRFMAREQVQKEQGASHEPEGVTSDE
jgi:hypothetical protein